MRDFLFTKPARFLSIEASYDRVTPQKNEVHLMSEYETVLNALAQFLPSIEASRTTLLRYRRQLKKFAAWCAQNEQTALPAAPETIVSFIEHLARERAASSEWETLSSALCGVHLAASFKSPTSDYRVEKAWLETLAPEETRKAVRQQLKNYVDWSRAKGLDALPASSKTVVRYLRHLIRHETPVATAYQALFAIEQAHRETGHSIPTDDAEVLKIQEQYHERLVSFMAQRTLLALAKRDDLWAKRDALLIALVYQFGFKTSELVALNVGDVTLCEGACLSKTHDTFRVTFPYAEDDLYASIPKSSRLSPAPLLRAWLKDAHIERGSLFRRIAKDGRVLDQRILQRSARSILCRAAEAAELKRGFSAQELYRLRRGGKTVRVRFEADDAEPRK